MKNEIVNRDYHAVITSQQAVYDIDNAIHSWTAPQFDKEKLNQGTMNDVSEILFITSYPPRECGIATYSQDLIKALNNKFSNSLTIKVCALEEGDVKTKYPQEVKYILKTSKADEYEKMAATINKDHRIKIVLIQHEFGFFKEQEQSFLQFLYEISKPVVIVFHTVLSHPDELLKSKIKRIAAVCDSIIVMTHYSAGILTVNYGLPEQKISVIAQGTHLVPYLSKEIIDKKYVLDSRKVFTAIGLPGSGTGIESTTAWENVAILHATLFERISDSKISIKYNLPEVNLDHLKQMTTNTGIIQFSKINQPDIDSGYTLDDNSQALIAMCMHHKLTGDEKDVHSIHHYLRFIKHCLQPGGDFLNYLDKDNKFTNQNKTTDLDDANGRAVWALGYLVSFMGLLPHEVISEAITIFKKTLPHIGTLNSTRAMAFAIKGLYYYHNNIKSSQNLVLIKTLADRLVRMYMHESDSTWDWFEGYLTYAKSTLPESMLYAWLLTDETIYREIAQSSFNFLLSQIFSKNGIEVISNKSWLKKGQKAAPIAIGGEQPMDVAYTIMTLSKFYEVFRNEDYGKQMEMAFNWFLGNNRLHQIIYNPCTGGCYDGLEKTHVNLNQGAESTVAYLMARITLEKYLNV